METPPPFLLSKPHDFQKSSMGNRLLKSIEYNLVFTKAKILILCLRIALKWPKELIFRLSITSSSFPFFLESAVYF